jgi:hypothetical protein
MGGGHRWMSGERGSAAIEGAIVTPLVMALLFGIIETGFVFKDYLAISGAVRAGVRVASANPRTVTFAQTAADSVARTGGAMNFGDVEELWVYEGARACAGCAPTDTPIGFSDFTDCSVCVKFRWDPGTKKFVKTFDNWLPSSQNACSYTSGGPPDRIGVHLKLRHEPFTGLVFNDSIHLAGASILSLEPLPVLVGCK